MYVYDHGFRTWHVDEDSAMSFHALPSFTVLRSNRITGREGTPANSMVHRCQKRLDPLQTSFYSRTLRSPFCVEWGRDTKMWLLGLQLKSHILMLPEVVVMVYMLIREHLQIRRNS